MQAAGLGVEIVLPDPEDRALPGCPQRHPHRKAGRGSEIGSAGRIDFVKRRTRDAAAERLIDTARAERDLPDLRRHATQRRVGKMAAQIGQDERVWLGPHGNSCSLFVLL